MLRRPESVSAAGKPGLVPASIYNLQIRCQYRSKCKRIWYLRYGAFHKLFYFTFERSKYKKIGICDTKLFTTQILVMNLQIINDNVGTDSGLSTAGIDPGQC